MTAAFLVYRRCGRRSAAAESELSGIRRLRTDRAGESDLLSAAGGQRFCVRHRRISSSDHAKDKSRGRDLPVKSDGQNSHAGRSADNIADALEGHRHLSDLGRDLQRSLFWRAAAFGVEFYDKTIIVSGLSKSLSMTGWRLGWVGVVNRRMSSTAIQVLHGFLTVCTSAITQKASLLAWTPEAEEAKQHARDVYKKRGEFLVDLFDTELGLKPLRLKERSIRCSMFARLATISRSQRNACRIGLSRFRASRLAMKRKVFCGSRSATPKSGWSRACGG